MQAIPVYVVSLERAAERRAAIARHLENLGLQFIMTNAVDGKALPEAERRALQADHIDFHAGVIGCYMSHINIYEMMQDGDAEMALVIEDDAYLNPDFVKVIRDGIDWKDFDYLFLDCDSTNGEGQVFFDTLSKVDFYKGYRAYRTHAGPPTTHAYIITKEAAKKRLDAAYPIDNPIDIYTSLPYTPCFYVMLGPRGAGVSEHSLTSLTSKRADTGTPTGLKKLKNADLYPVVVDAVKLGPLKRRKERKAFEEAGVLPKDGKWKGLPPGRAIKFD